MKATKNEGTIYIDRQCWCLFSELDMLFDEYGFEWC